MAQLMPLLLTVSCFSKIQIGFAFLVPAPWVVPDKGPLNGCVCVCVCVCVVAANAQLVWHAIALLEKAVTHSPSNFQFKLLLVQLYCTLGEWRC